MTAPAVSVLMPVYNAGPYLAPAIASVLGQTFGDFELIAVDDGSTDNSRQMLAGIADPRLRVIEQPNRGIVDALNAALAQARAPLVARMDADDLALPQRLEKQVAFLAAHPDHVAVGCRTLAIDPDGDPIESMNQPLTHEQIEARCLGAVGGAIAHPTLMARREAVQRAGGYRPQFLYAEDLDLYLRLMPIGKLANLPDVLLHYRQHPASIMASRRTLSAQRAVQAANEARAARGLPPLPPPPDQPAGGDPRYGWIIASLYGGHRRTARKLMRQVLAAHPASWQTWRTLAHVLAGPAVRGVIGRKQPGAA